MSATAQMEPALILHVRPYQESSAIVQMLTLGQGRMAGVLRGYRSKKQGQVALQPFSVGTVSWAFMSWPLGANAQNSDATGRSGHGLIA